MEIVFSPRCLEYQQPGHPEASERVGKTYEFLKDKGFTFIEPQLCTNNDILLVHAKEHLERVKQGNFFDVDTPNLPGIDEFARLAAGAALKACDVALERKTAFSLMRPPGHHAGQNSIEGFCYFNNIAIAVEKAVKKRGIKRVAIFDIDCHHGNGTEDIFRGRNNVLYVSLHEAGIYPGTGFTSYDNCINVPLQAGTGEKKYLEALDQGLRHVLKFKPNVIAVSAGFDTYKKDPLCHLQVEVDTYKIIGRKLVSLNIPLFAVLEGGYSEELPQCIFYFLKGLGV